MKTEIVGSVTAYADAVAAGYKGTHAEFSEAVKRVAESNIVPEHANIGDALIVEEVNEAGTPTSFTTANIPIQVKFGEPTVLVEETTLSFHKDGDNNWYVTEENPISGFTQNNFTRNTLYKVTWDGAEYELFFVEPERPKEGGTGFYEWGAIGNCMPLGNQNSHYVDAPFCIAFDYHRNAGEVQVFAFSNEEHHILSITAIPFTPSNTPIQYYGIPQDIKYYRPLVFMGSGDNSVVESGALDASGDYSHAEGSVTTASGSASHAEGCRTTASGKYSHAKGYKTLASGLASHAEGNSTIASATGSHAEGYVTTASAEYSHAEGYNTEASGVASHAEGYITKATGQDSHAEGARCIASNFEAHAEGYKSEAHGEDSHAEGFGTYAGSNYQHTQGKWNAKDTASKYAHIVGNGTSDTERSNAYTLDWDGNGWFQGNLEAAGGVLKLGGIELSGEDLAIGQAEFEAMLQEVFG